MTPLLCIACIDDSFDDRSIDLDDGDKHHAVSVYGGKALCWPHLCRRISRPEGPR